MRRRQYDKFIGTDKVLLFSVEEEVRNFLYKLRKNAADDSSLLLRLLSLIKCQHEDELPHFDADAVVEATGDAAVPARLAAKDGGLPAINLLIIAK